jgi:hypothetical protein
MTNVSLAGEVRPSGLFQTRLGRVEPSQIVLTRRGDFGLKGRVVFARWSSDRVLESRVMIAEVRCGLEEAADRRFAGLAGIKMDAGFTTTLEVILEDNFASSLDELFVRSLDEIFAREFEKAFVAEFDTRAQVNPLIELLTTEDDFLAKNVRLDRLSGNLGGGSKMFLKLRRINSTREDEREPIWVHGVPADGRSWHDEYRLMK